ncbi:MAG TPA: TetR/AcrR family transcriptional regulator [Candidatus Binatus sp.]|nr:TetR/AcrR family transcriptional regulator [Candidatus Binatus sp.]
MAPVAADPTIRRQVMSAAREALREDPAAPIDEISRRAGVSRATFYRHFGSRASLLASVAHEPRPTARVRILGAAEEMLVSSSLADLSMDRLAVAAGVSRGTLYRLFPGKPSLLRGLFEANAPFEAIRGILTDHREDPPQVVLPLIAGEVVGVAGERLGLMRAILHEATLASGDAISGVRRPLAGMIPLLAEYLAHQMDLGRVRRMDPILALQAFIGPLFFHFLTRPLLEELVGLPMTAGEAAEQLVGVSVAGLAQRSIP